MTVVRVHGVDVDRVQFPAARFLLFMINHQNKQTTQEYLEDYRQPIKQLYSLFQKLADLFSFTEKIIFTEKILSYANHRQIDLPAFSYTSPKTGPALWIISGIHGEEPAGPNAIANKIDQIGSLSKEIPIVILPLCNPKGYFFNWRYPNQDKYSSDDIGQSVGDSEHLLPTNPDNPQYPRANQPSCFQSQALTSHILKLAKIYPPILSLDFHEDNLLDKGYIYSQGSQNENDPVALQIVQLLLAIDYPLFLSGQTRFQQKITSGVVEKSLDGSIDELIAADKIYLNHQWQPGPKAKSVIVVETAASNQPLSQRQLAQELLLDNLEKLWKTANAQ